MRNFLLSLVLLACSSAVVSAQNYKPFKLGLGLGYAHPSDGGGGVLFDFEPAYRINDAIAVGLRIESAWMARGLDDSGADVSANGSYSLNGQYYLSDSKVRPYVGLGFGLFSSASVSVSNNGSAGADASENKFGFYPRLGIDIGHFNINFDYNIIGKSEGTASDSQGRTFTYDIKNSYFGIRLGAFIFGGEN
ncbi:outer membrane beta-barrel protein [Fulvivirga sediminis]|uniref:Outer membrane beta-barrel protein n=1 Tax=Fulvivirga sediminis TaxID=2803949 RepID=A0A937FBU9_9BACT|nr:outer membrane beta-barrel protein [Fulvivirga sediminis]MBL3658005.1 outer membrane beta-barrel protein [Fulvivirga sediminis]